MKKLNYIVLCVLLGVGVTASARMFEKGERLYFNGTPSSAYWWMDHTSNPSDPEYTRLWAYFYNGGSHKWIEAHIYGTSNFYVEETDANEWTHVILTRHRGWVNEPAFDANCLNQTGDINLNASTSNYLQNFFYGSSHEEANWWVIAPSPTGDPAEWSLPYEDEQICTSAAGTEYVLAPKNYDYDNSKNHAWFKYDGSWTRLDGDEFRGSEGLQDFEVTLDGANSDTYYFMQAGKPSACRLIRVRLNQDCSEGAPGACKITSFVAVASEANVTDQTSAINGVVAFDDKKNAGNLMVWCENVDTVTIPNDEIETPQTFKLKGFDASTTKNYTLYAKFLGGTSACEASCVVTVHPPTAPITTHTTTQTASDLRLTRFTEEDVTLTPTNQTSTYFQWTNSADDDKFSDIRNRTFTAPAEEQDIEYVFLATQDPPEPAGNLIENGTFEDPSKDAILESNYDDWGRDQTDYYTVHPGASGGYAIIQNSTMFYHTYNQVTAHEGKYFALFDSKVWDGTDQAAWVASTALNPKLKVEAGVSYLFSFWVANVNNFGEMNNGAQLQFQISYNGGSTWSNLGDMIDLGDYRDNRWHGISSIATPSVTSTNVKIRVINLNTSLQNRGNDFALDDIRFEAVTANTAHIAAFERFPVKYLKCVINTATFVQRQPVGCGTAVADVDYTVTFTHPRGDLYIYEGATELAHIPHSTIGDETTSYVGVLPNRPVDNNDHELTVYFEDALVKTDAPTTYTYNAKAVPAINVKSLTWNAQPCDVTTATLTAVIEYTNQNGTLTANVDGGTDVSETYTVESDDKKEVTLVIPGIVADGKTGHKLNVAFSGSHGCSIVNHAIPTAAPYMPSVTVSAPEIQTYSCGDGTYEVKVSAAFSNGQLHDIIFKDWKTGAEVHEATTVNDGVAEHIFSYAWDATPASHEYNVYFDGAVCDHKKSYTSPAEPALAESATYIGGCDVATFTLNLALTYTNQRGTTFYASVDGGTPVSVANPNPGAQAGKSDVMLSLPGLPADGKSHTYSIWTDDAKDCSRINIAFPAPYQPVISATAATVQSYACKDAQYSVKVEAEFSNGQGHNLIFEDWNGNKQTIATVASDTKKEYTFSYDWESPATHAYKVYFEGAESCADSHKPSFTSPVEPKIENVSYSVTSVTACDVTTYDMTVTFDYYNQDGTLSVDVDGTAATSIIPALVANSTSKQSATATFVGLPADGGTGHVITVKTIGGSHNCEATKKITSVQHLPVINTVSQSFTPDFACGDNQYHVTLSVNYTNALGKSIQIKEGTTILKSVTANTGAGTFSEDIQLDFDFATNHNLDVYFEGREDCAEHISISSPAEPTLAESATYIGGCDVATYTLNLALTYTNQRGTTFYASVDGGTPVSVANPNPGAQMEKSDVMLSLPGLPADGNAHTYSIWTDDAKDCSRINIAFPAPYQPVISATAATVQSYACKDVQYSVKVEAEFANGQGHNLIFEDWNGKKQTIATIASDTKKEYTFSYDWESPATHAYKVYLEGAESCADSHKPSFTSPVEPKIENVSYSVTSVTACDVTTYDMTVTFDYYNQDGTLSVDVDGTAATSITPDFLKNSTTKQSATATFTGLPADGASHTITVMTTGGSHNCSATQAFDAPVTPCINPKKYVYSTPSCTETLTTLTFDLDYTYQRGILTYWVDEMTDAKQSKAYAVDDKTLKTLSALTFANIPADGKAHTLHVSFDGANSCVKDFALPAAPFSSVIDAVVLTSEVPALITCETSSYNVDVEITTHYDATGEKVQLTYNDKGVAVTSAPITVSGTKASATLTLHNIADGNHTIDAAFVSTPACKTSSAAYTAPSIAMIHDFTVSATDRACDADNYSISGSIAFDKPDGDLIVVFDASHTDTIKAPVTSPAAFTIGNMSSDGTGLEVTAKFSNSPTCTKVSTFDAPVKPSILAKNFAYAPVGCTETLTTLTFDLDYTYQRGILTYWVDEMTDAKQSKAYAVDDKTLKTLSALTFANIPADGKAHTLHVSFDGANSCVKDFALPAAPLTDALTSVEVSSIPANILCDETKYIALVTVTMPYDMAIGKNIVIAHEGITSTFPASSNPLVATVTMTTADATGLTVDAYFEGLPTCKVTSAAFNAPKRLSCNVQKATVCENDYFTWPLTGLTYGPFTETGNDTIVNADNIHDTLLVTVCPQPQITLKAIDTLYQNATHIRVPYTVTRGTPNLFDVTVGGVLTSVKRTTVDTIVIAKPASVTTGDYTFEVVVKDTFLTCTTDATPITFHVAGVPTVNTLTVNPQEVACGSKAYDVNVHAVYQNPRGRLVIENKTSGQKYYCLAPSSAYNTDYEKDTVIHIASLTPSSLNWEAYFEGWSSKAATSEAPSVPEMNISAVTPSVAGCETTASVTFNVNYTYQQGQMTYWVDTQAKKIHAITEKNATPVSVNDLSFAGFDADGLSHKLHVRFDGTNSCEDSVVFTAPVSNALTSAVMTSIPENVLCDQTNYSALVTVAMPFDKSIGKTIVIAHEGKNDEVVVTANPMVAHINMTTVDATGLTFETYFAGHPECKITSSPFNAPKRLSCNVQLASVCEGDSYTWSLTGLSYGPFTKAGKDTIVSALNIHDTLIVTVNAQPQITLKTIDNIIEEATEIRLPYSVTNGTPNAFEVTLASVTTPLKRSSADTLVIAKPGSVTVGDYEVTVLVKDTNTNCTSNTSLPIHIVEKAVAPSMAIENVTLSTLADCAKTFSVSFDLSYVNQTGTLRYWLDENEAAAQTVPFVAGDKNTQTISGLTLAEVPADGLSHEIHVAFKDAEGSKDAAVFTAPLSSAIDQLAVSGVPATVLCDQADYEVSVTITLPFDKSIGKTIVIAHEGKKDEVVVTVNPMVASITMSTVDASGLTMSAHFADAPSCFTTSNSFSAPTRLSCEKVNVTVCEGDSYTWPLTGLSYGPFTKAGKDTIVSALNIHDTLIVTVNSQPQITLKAIDNIVEEATEIRLPYSVTNGTPNAFEVTLAGVTTPLKRSSVDTLVIAKPGSVTVGDYEVTVLVKDTNTNCTSNTSLPIHIVEKTVAPSMAIENVTLSTLADCAKTFSVSFDLSYVNQTGTLRYWLDENEAAAQTVPFVAGDKNTQTISGLTLAEVPADGLSHEIHVAFKDAEGSKDAAVFTAPATHAIDTVTVSGIPASIMCDKEPYNASVRVYLPYVAEGVKLVLHYEDRDTAIYAGSDKEVTAIIVLHTTDATGLSLTARYCDAPSCPVSTTYDAPAFISCVKDYVDICEGESYTWPLNGVTYSPASAGLYTYAQDYDTLFLTVRVEPVIRVDPIDRICKDQTEIRWPFAVLAGTPDVFTARIDGKDYNLTADGAELVLPIPAALPAGDYKAVITVKDAAISCTSTVETGFTLAADDLIYSKWSDVLFINNVDKLFVTFQWFENGNLIAGEDKQYLFKQSGLPELYYCRMTTTDNKTVYTCEISFDDAIPSRTVNNGEPQAQSVRMYDPMGRIVTGTPTNGIYIIVEEVDGIQMVRKIAVYE